MKEIDVGSALSRRKDLNNREGCDRILAVRVAWYKASLDVAIAIRPESGGDEYKCPGHWCCICTTSVFVFSHCHYTFLSLVFFSKYDHCIVGTLLR